MRGWTALLPLHLWAAGQALFQGNAFPKGCPKDSLTCTKRQGGSSDRGFFSLACIFLLFCVGGVPTKKIIKEKDALALGELWEELWS